MNRDIRWADQGLIFFGLTIILFLFFTDKGIACFNDLFKISNNGLTSKQLLPIASILVIIFSSNAIGYIINQITVFCLCSVRCCIIGKWYSSEWDKEFNFKKNFVDILINNLKDSEKILNLKKYTSDVFFSYFWQQEDKTLIDWISRRHTIYWKNCSVVCAIILSFFMYFILLFISPLEIENFKILIFLIIISLFIVYIFGTHARVARKEAAQFLSIWVNFLYEMDPKKKTIDLFHKKLKDI